MGVFVSPVDMLSMMNLGQPPKYRTVLRGYGKTCRPGDYIELTSPGYTLQGVLLRIEDVPIISHETHKNLLPIKLLMQANPLANPNHESGWTSFRLMKGARVTRVAPAYLRTVNSLVAP